MTSEYTDFMHMAPNCIVTAMAIGVALIVAGAVES